MQTNLLPAPAPSVPGFPCAWSADRQHRFTLWRHWGQTAQPRYLMVIGLNPSTADEEQDDPTIRRCVDFARRWGYTALCMTNLFAFRATDPEVMKRALDPIGFPANDEWLAQCALRASMVLAAWGVHGSFQGRDRYVIGEFERWRIPLHALGLTAAGHPRHPLYVRGDTLPIPFPGEVAHG